MTLLCTNTSVRGWQPRTWMMAPIPAPPCQALPATSFPRLQPCAAVLSATRHTLSNPEGAVLLSPTSPIPQSQQGVLGYARDGDWGWPQPGHPQALLQAPGLAGKVRCAWMGMGTGMAGAEPKRCSPGTGWWVQRWVPS